MGRNCYLVDTRRKFNALCTFNLRPVSTGYLQAPFCVIRVLLNIKIIKQQRILKTS